MVVSLLPTHIYRLQTNYGGKRYIGAWDWCLPPSLRVLLTQYPLPSHNFSMAVQPLMKLVFLMFVYEFQNVSNWSMLSASRICLLVVWQRVAHIDFMYLRDLAAH